MNLHRSLIDPKSNGRRFFRGLLLMSIAATAMPAQADQPIVLPPAIPGDGRPVMKLGGVESAKPLAAQQPVATQHLVKQSGLVVAQAPVVPTQLAQPLLPPKAATPVDERLPDAQAAPPPATLVPQPQLNRPAVPALKLLPATTVVKAPQSSANTEAPTKIETPVVNDAATQATRRAAPTVETTRIESSIVEQASQARQQPSRRPQPQIVEQRPRANFEGRRPEGEQREPQQVRNFSNREAPENRGPQDRVPPDRRPQEREGDRGPENRERDREPENRGDRAPEGRGDRGPEGRGDRAPEGRGDRAPEGRGDRGPGDRGPGDRGPDLRGPGDRGPEGQGPDNRGPEGRGPEGRGPEGRGPIGRDFQGPSWAQNEPRGGMLFVPGNAQPGTPPVLRLGAPGMDARIQLAPNAADPDKLLASPMVKRLLELMEQNIELKAQLKIQQIEQESMQRVRELESALRSKEERSQQTSESLLDKQRQLEKQRDELRQMEQRLDALRKALEQQRDELQKREATKLKGQGEIKIDRKGAEADIAREKHQQIEVRIIDKDDARELLAIKKSVGDKDDQGEKQAKDPKVLLEIRSMAEKLAKSEAALKESNVSKELQAKRLAELEHRSRLLEEKAKALAEQKNAELNIGERRELAEQARRRAEEEKKLAEAKKKELKKEEARKKDGDKKDGDKKDDDKEDGDKKDKKKDRDDNE